MRIGMLTTGYPHDVDPVSGAFVREMARALVARGHRVDVLCAEAPRGAPLEDPGVRVRAVRYAARRAFASTFYGAGAPDNLARGSVPAWLGAGVFPAALALATAGALSGCDAIVSHFVLPCGAVGGALRAGRPHLAIAHGTDAHLFARAPVLVQRAVLAGTTALQFTHHALRASLDASVRDDPRVFVSPMGYAPSDRADPHERDQLRAALLGARQGAIVLAVARLVPVKGIGVLIEALARLARGGEEVSGVIAGDGPERDALEREARASGAPVRFEGAVGPARRDALLGAADAFALPSLRLPDGRTEGAPVALLEAMGARLACVASDAGGVREVAGDAALLVRPGDAGALADVLARLARDSALRAELGARAVERASPHRWDRVAERVERVLAR